MTTTKTTTTKKKTAAKPVVKSTEDLVLDVNADAVVSHARAMMRTKADPALIAGYLQAMEPALAS